MSTQLTLSTAPRENAAVVSVGGEIDLGSAGELSDYLVDAMQQTGPDLVLDLSDVTFMDSTGLKVFLATHRRLQLVGGRLALAGPGRPVRRVLTVTGLDQMFLLTETVDEALEALRSRDLPRAASD